MAFPLWGGAVAGGLLGGLFGGEEEGGELPEWANGLPRKLRKELMRMLFESRQPYGSGQVGRSVNSGLAGQLGQMGEQQANTRSHLGSLFSQNNSPNSGDFLRNISESETGQRMYAQSQAQDRDLNARMGMRGTALSGLSGLLGQAGGMMSPGRPGTDFGGIFGQLAQNYGMQQAMRRPSSPGTTGPMGPGQGPGGPNSWTPQQMFGTQQLTSRPPAAPGTFGANFRAGGPPPQDLMRMLEEMFRNRG